MTIFHGALINDSNFNEAYYDSITSRWEGIILAIYCTIVLVFGLAGKLNLSYRVFVIALFRIILKFARFSA
jgi:hypothetical protein